MRRRRREFLMVQVMCVATAFGCHQQSVSRTEQPLLSDAVTPGIPVSGGDLQAEPSVARFQDEIIVAWNDSYGGAHGSSTGVSAGWAYSSDGGRTFAARGLLPDSARDQLPSGADTWLGVDRNGQFYLQVLTWQRDRQEILLYRMNRKERGRWRAPVTVATRRGGLVDKPAMAVRNDGAIAITYTCAEPTAICLTVSRDQGESWSPVRIVSDTSERVRTGASVGFDGDSIVVAWLEGDGIVLKDVYVATTPVGAVEGAVKHDRIYTLTADVRPLRGYALGVGPAGNMANNTWLAIDAGTAFLSFAERRGARNVALLVSRAQGRWGAPQVVSDSSTSVAFPAVAAINGVPHLLFYAQAPAPSAETHVVLASRHSDGSWTRQNLTGTATDWSLVKGDRARAPVQRNFGDYITLTRSGPLLVAAWTEGREGQPRVATKTVLIR